MRLLEWLFRKKWTAPEDLPKALPETLSETMHKVTPGILPKSSPGNLIELTETGKFSLFVVGESYYQDNLKQICGEYSVDGINYVLNASLIHADNNQYDSEAIRVEISGKTVGHMSKTDANTYRTYMRSKNWSGLTAICKAKITGGWDRGQGDIGHYGVSLDLPSDFIKSFNSIVSANLKEEDSSEPNTIIFDVERPHIRDVKEVGANVKLWTPKDDPGDVYIFHRDGPDGRIGTVPYKYADIIISHILDGLEYKATIIEIGIDKCKIKCRLISKEETELRKAKEREVLRTELTKPYNPKKPITLVFVMKKKKSAKIGEKLYVEFDDLDSYVQGQLNIRFINRAGNVVGDFSYDSMEKMRRLIKAHFNSFLLDVEVLDIEEERNRAWGGYLTKLIVTTYKK